MQSRCSRSPSYAWRVLQRVKADAKALEARYAKLPERNRLLRSPPGYYNGIKAARDTLGAFGRVYRYWVGIHFGALLRAGIMPPPCPTGALMLDVIPEARRVKSIPWSDL